VRLFHQSSPAKLWCVVKIKVRIPHPWLHECHPHSINECHHKYLDDPRRSFLCAVGGLALYGLAEPWGLSVHSPGAVPGEDYQVATDLGLASRAVLFNYGATEGEPSFPMTNFGDDAAFNAGQAAALRGVVGNAQTHCLQLPNTFAFARGFQGDPITDEDYVTFAEELIGGYGQLIVQAWNTPV